MKRLVQSLGLLLLLLAAAFIWLSLRKAALGAVQAAYLCHTNIAGPHGVALLQITNRSSEDYAMAVDTQELVGKEWNYVRYNSIKPGANSSYSGWLGAHSNAVIQVAAPIKGERFCLSYERVPSKAENWLSWTLTWIGVRNPFASRRRTVLIYPDPK